MKTILFLWLLTFPCFASDKVGRYRLFHTELTVVNDAGAYVVKALFRIDTVTGRSWILLPDGEGLGGSNWNEIGVHANGDVIPGTRYRRGDVLSEIGRLQNTIRWADENPNGGVALDAKQKDKPLSASEVAAAREECFTRIDSLLAALRRLDGTNPPPEIPIFPRSAVPAKKTKKP